MITIRTFAELQSHPRPLHVAIGVFDGLHLGHQEVMHHAIEAARAQGGDAALLTFDPHPIRVIAPNKAPVGLLTPLPHKSRLAQRMGLAVFAPLHFDRRMAEMPAEDFLAQLTMAQVRTIAVGEDWRFGHNREGDVHLLSRHASPQGYQLMAVPPLMWRGDRISSTRIRQALLDGNLDHVCSMLGRPWSFLGTVQRGDAIGRTLGFPTANLLPVDVQLPPNGVWTATASTSTCTWPAVANLGNRPTVGGSEVRLEVHLLNANPDLYGQEIEVSLHHFLRPEQRFSSTEDLRSAISQDVSAARTWHQEQGSLT